eukprot:3679672-Amphidinium_carterae.1
MQRETSPNEFFTQRRAVSLSHVVHAQVLVELIQEAEHLSDELCRWTSTWQQIDQGGHETHHASGLRGLPTQAWWVPLQHGLEYPVILRVSGVCRVPSMQPLCEGCKLNSLDAFHRVHQEGQGATKHILGNTLIHDMHPIWPHAVDREARNGPQWRHEGCIVMDEGFLRQSCVPPWCRGRQVFVGVLGGTAPERARTHA